jgi:carbonic anhydrase/acetyltransferase-like protein (isoleucine patch superfamily)
MASIVCGQLRGNVILGENCIIHPQVIIDAGHSSNTIVLGHHVIIQEKTRIQLSDAIGSSRMTIGDYVIIESAAQCYGESIGNFSRIGCKGMLLECAKEGRRMDTSFFFQPF